MKNSPDLFTGRLGTALTLVLNLGGMLMTAGVGQAQAVPDLLSTEVRLADFGLAAVEEIRKGRLSVAYTTPAPSLGVYFLRDSVGLPPPPPGVVKLLPEPHLPPPLTPGRRGDLQKALWVWNTRELLDDPHARQRFLEYVVDQGFSRIFLQIPPAPGTRPEAGFVPFDGARLGELVAELRRRGAVTYALDGDPAYALQANHAGVLATVQRVVAHNATASPEARFHGVRYDIEPYLVPGFQGPRRGEILDGYVSLIRKISALTRPAGLALGVDVPFWLDMPDEETGAPLTAEDEGRLDTVLGHLLRWVDDMAIMDYRTRAYGPDGAVTHALGELAAAEQAGVGVYVALETEKLVDEDLYTFRGHGTPGLPPDDGGPWVILAPSRVWLLSNLGEGGAGPLAQGPGSGSGRARLIRELAAAGLTPSSTLWWPAGRPVRVPADKQSFHDLGLAALETASQRIIRRLGGSPAFMGLAYHHYGSLSALGRPPS